MLAMKRNINHQTMRTEITITEQEKRILQNINLTGTMGKCGNMKQPKRLSILLDLVSRGLLTPDAKITKLGIEVSSPFSNQ